MNAPPIQPLLHVRGLTVRFSTHRGLSLRRQQPFTAVDDVSFDIMPGETLGLVGESGSGKTTVGRTILRLTRATAGVILFDGVDVLTARAGALKQLRRSMQIVFQDPGGSLNPIMRIADAVAEPMAVHDIGGTNRRRATLAVELLERCGISPSLAQRYPHQLSGGQRQRVAIARALALSPRLVVCDEPTSALDVSVQAQILNLLTELQAERRVSYLFISHDIGVIQHMCRRVAVMQGGKIVEVGEREQILRAPAHPYTRALLAAVPSPDPRAAGAA